MYLFKIIQSQALLSTLSNLREHMFTYMCHIRCRILLHLQPLPLWQAMHIYCLASLLASAITAASVVSTIFMMSINMGFSKNMRQIARLES